MVHFRSAHGGVLNPYALHRRLLQDADGRRVRLAHAIPGALLDAVYLDVEFHDAPRAAHDEHGARHHHGRLRRDAQALWEQRAGLGDCEKPRYDHSQLQAVGFEQGPHGPRKVVEPSRDACGFAGGLPRYVSGAARHAHLQLWPGKRVRVQLRFEGFHKAHLRGENVHRLRQRRPEGVNAAISGREDQERFGGVRARAERKRLAAGDFRAHGGAEPPPAGDAVAIAASHVAMPDPGGSPLRRVCR
mmetsp:Transcript_120886/g.341823  ORF Transcript_120886/g.341823 Transcript_120886/m.341823 type:complete len:245 (+) Transcript_120886:1711-2445(+)